MAYATLTNNLLDEKMYGAINQIRHKKKQRRDIERICNYMIIEEYELIYLWKV